MKTLINILIVVCFVSSCNPLSYSGIDGMERHTTEVHTLNEYLIVNNTSKEVDVVLNNPKNTDKHLYQGDTLRYFFEDFTSDGMDRPLMSPFNGASYAKISFDEKAYTFNLDNPSAGNPLCIDNYTIIRNDCLYYTFIFNIEIINYE